MKETETWLTELGLDQYIGAFNENHIDWDTLDELNDADLREIGITSLGHRKKLLRVIAELGQKGPEATPSTSRRQPTEAETERRQVTVMFCDLVGSTRLSTLLDPEDTDAVIRKYQDTVTPVVREFGGYVARFAGDGILIYFGYPQALEMEAERAIRAALKVARKIEHAEFHPGTSSQVRIGIATGGVVIGGLYDEGKLYEAMATGETPNLAARLQGVAEPGGIVICDLTRRLAGNVFSFRDEGEQEFKGFSRPARVWLVTGSVVAEDRFHALHSGDGPTPLAGREKEQQVLWENWQKAQRGNGRGVFITGEAGMGKSRLFKSLADRSALQDLNYMNLQCEPYSRNTPFHPVVNFFQRAIGIGPEDELDMQLQRLQKFLALNYDAPDDIFPIIANLLDIEQTDISCPLADYSPQRLMEETIQTGVALVKYRASSAPLLILAEDLHCADPSTLKFLEVLFENLADQMILLVITARPELDKSSIGSNDFDHIHLDHLDAREVDQIIDRLDTEGELAVSHRSQIQEKSDGIPLYVEELTKSMLEQLGEDLPGTELEPDAYDVSVPSALQTSLMARLDRLWDVKGFTLSCAVIGREFSRELAAHVSSLREEDIDQALKKLIDAELVQPLSQYSNERYMFRHALLRDAAYNNLLRSRRRDIHSRVAEVLVQHYPKTVAMEPERLARHYAGAERYIDANEYYLVAGLKAAHGGATLEAVEHLQRGVDLLKYIEDDSARLPLELDLNLALGPALVAVRGFGAEEVEASFSRGRVLCNKIGASEKLLPALHGLMDYYIVRARFEDALEVAREFGEAMPRTNNVGHRLELQWSMGSANLFKGDVLEARELLEQGLPLYNREEHADHAVTYGQDPGVALMTHLAITLTLQGEYTRSREVEQRVMDLVSVLDHPLTKAQASVFLQGCAAFRGELNRTLELSEQCIGYCQEQGFPLFMGMATMYKGHYLCERGDDSGLALIYQGFDIYTLSGADVSTSLYLAMTAECELSCGTVERGLECIERAYQRVHNTGEWLYFPMLKYVEARLLLKRNQGRDALDACELMLDCVQRALAASTRHFAGQAAHHLVSLAPELPGGKQILVRLHACVPDVDELLALNREIVD